MIGIDIIVFCYSVFTMFCSFYEPGDGNAKEILVKAIIAGLIFTIFFHGLMVRLA